MSKKIWQAPKIKRIAAGSAENSKGPGSDNTGANPRS